MTDVLSVIRELACQNGIDYDFHDGRFELDPPWNFIELSCLRIEEIPNADCNAILDISNNDSIDLIHLYEDTISEVLISEGEDDDKQHLMIATVYGAMLDFRLTKEEA